MRFDQHLRIFSRILNEYPGDTPLSKFLPGYFKENKQMGSNDRRTASRLLYNYFRIGKTCAHLPVEEKLFIAEFLCHRSSNEFLNHFKPALNAKIGLPIKQKINYLSEIVGFNIKEVFPFTSHLSKGIQEDLFSESFFIQPDLFIRIHPGKYQLVKQTLSAAGVEFRECTNDALALPNGTKLEIIFGDERPFEVQDWASQETGKYFQPKQYEYWWDACAASGGKSLLLFHQQPDIKLLVSDLRDSVLKNLDERFINAGLRTYHKKQLDLTQNVDPELHHYQFDGIILDAPCTGSGTWGRTPEMISQFEEYKIQGFQNLQKAISGNVIKYLKPGKPLIYITCSVFRQENEEVVNFLIKEHHLKLENQQIITGYEQKADTMFVARLSF